MLHSLPLRTLLILALSVPGTRCALSHHEFWTRLQHRRRAPGLILDPLVPETGVQAAASRRATCVERSGFTWVYVDGSDSESGSHIGRCAYRSRTRVPLCQRLGVEILDASPIRSPLVVVEALLPYVEGKSVCSVGTRRGDIHACLQRFIAGNASWGIDRLESYCKVVEKRGVRTKCGNFVHMGGASFPQCEVYYWWPINSATDTPWFLEHIAKQHHDLDNAISIVGYDQQYERDVRSLEVHTKAFGPEEVMDIYFDERDLAIAESAKLSSRERTRQNGSFSMAVYQMRAVANRLTSKDT